MDLGDLGLAFPLFFSLMKNLTIILLAAFLVAGVPCLIGNLHGGQAGHWGKGSDVWYISASLGGYGSSKPPLW